MTTVPAPAMVNTRSIHNRTGASDAVLGARPRAGLLHRGFRVGEVGAGHNKQAVPYAQGMQRGQMLGRLGSPALVRRDHDHDRGSRADTGSSAQRSGSIPASARSRVDLP
ncbi:hypothetical protein ACQEVF_22660 [Nonomuraea polychroma]|uniref:hypothetical protein n=1 Tax=Nonomuraea polychroma TaxID=46176 RepID=UPI003D8E2C56